MQQGTLRTAKKAPFIRAIAVTATGNTFANAQAAQLGPLNNINANASELIIPPAIADADTVVIDIFTGANPASIYFKDVDGSLGGAGIPLPANFFYSFQMTGIYSLVFVGAAASTVTVVVWKQEDVEARWAPAELGETFERLNNTLDRIFPARVEVAS